MPEFAGGDRKPETAGAQGAASGGAEAGEMRYPASGHPEPRNLDIEALRVYAISITIVAHVGTLVPEWTGWSQYFWLGGGVDLFFCLSGFLITRSLLALLEKSSGFAAYAKTFWVRRIFRLFPAAIFWSTTVLVISLVIGNSRALGLTSSLMTTWIGSLFDVVNLQIYSCFPDFSNQCSPNALWHYWSLSLEEQFYLIIPIVLFFVRPRLLLVCLLAGGLAQAWAPRPWGGLLWFIRSDALLFGCSIALLMHHGIDARLRGLMSRHRLAVRALLGFFLITLIVTARAAISIHFMGFVSVSAAAIVFIVASDNLYISKTPWIARAARYLGSRSYSLYLVHHPILALSRDITLSLVPGMLDHQAGRAVTFVVAVSVAVVFAELSYRFLEEPSRLFGRRITRGRSAPAQVAVSYPASDLPALAPELRQK